MAAPLGFKTFTTGEVLTAADTNGYLMQGIWTFANAAARNAAVTAPIEGNTCYLSDTDVIQVYSGSAWVTKSGAPSPLTTKGDVYTYSTVDARIGVGANDTVLTADSTAATGLKWATPAAGGMTLLSTTTLSGTSTTISSINQNFNNLQIVISGTVGAGLPAIRANGSTTITFAAVQENSTNSFINGGVWYFTVFEQTNNAGIITIYNYASTTHRKPFFATAGYGANAAKSVNGYFNTTSAITSFEINGSGDTFTGGQVLIYGVK